MPKSMQGKAKAMLHEMWQAPTKETALAAYEHFLSSSTRHHERDLFVARQSPPRFREKGSSEAKHAILCKDSHAFTRRLCDI